MNSNAIMRKKQYKKELKRRGVISENADPVEIAAAISNESSSSFGSIGATTLTGSI